MKRKNIGLEVFALEETLNLLLMIKETERLNLSLS